MANNRNKKHFLFGLRQAALLVFCILAGTAMILVAYKLPTTEMRKNVKKSISTLEREGIYYPLFDTLNSRLDNFTDAIMLGNVAITQNQGAIIDSMGNYHAYDEEMDNIESLKAYLNKEEVGLSSYGRYWHGYVVLLKPLFAFFTYGQIRALNALAQLVLLLFVCILLAKRKQVWLCLPFLVTWWLLCPPAMMLSLQFSSVFYIALFACMTVLLFHEKMDKELYPYLFLVTGAATSYFDLLTYPVFTFVLPLSLIVAFRCRQTTEKRKPLLYIVGYGFSWCMGYVGMWCGKWIVAGLLTGNDYISESINQILFRVGTASATGEAMERTVGFERSLNTLLITPAPFVLILAAVVCVLLLLTNRKRIHCSASTIYPFFILACIPIAWLIFTCNHSSIHYWFTFRALTASVFSLLTGMLAQIGRTENEESTIHSGVLYK